MLFCHPIGSPCQWQVPLNGEGVAPKGTAKCWNILFIVADFCRKSRARHQWQAVPQKADFPKLAPRNDLELFIENYRATVCVCGCGCVGVAWCVCHQIEWLACKVWGGTVCVCVCVAGNCLRKCHTNIITTKKLFFSVCFLYIFLLLWKQFQSDLSTAKKKDRKIKKRYLIFEVSFRLSESF